MMSNSSMKRPPSTASTSSYNIHDGGGGGGGGLMSSLDKYQSIMIECNTSMHHSHNNNNNLGKCVSRSPSRSPSASCSRAILFYLLINQLYLFQTPHRQHAHHHSFNTITKTAAVFKYHPHQSVLLYLPLLL